MVAAIATRSRAPADYDSPPAKKARHSNGADQPNGLEHIIFGNGTGKVLTAKAIPTVKDAQKDRYDESRAVIGQGEDAGHGDVDMPNAAVVEISSDSEEEDDEEELEDAGAGGEVSEDEEEELRRDGPKEQSVELGEAGTAREEPSFGELLQANNTDTIDVEAPFSNATEQSTALARKTGTQSLSIPSATSLGTVLTQALRTNDRELLETCFEVEELDSVRSTIERLPSPLVGNLLHKLAERLHKRPGRAGKLMVWVQWALVSHGGYLAGQRDVTKRLSSLSRVLKERANGLQPLLSLKGKLDMLSAQLEMRRNIQAARRGGTSDDDDNEAVVYVEGQPESDSDNELAVNQEALAIKAKSTKGARAASLDFAGAESSGDEGEMPITNGVDASSEGSEGEEDEDLIDDEAEETDADTGEEATSDDGFEEFDDGEEMLEGEEQPPSTKRSQASLRSSFGRR